MKIDEKGFASWNYNPYFQTDEAMGNHNGREQSEFVWEGGLTIPFLYKAKKAGFEVDAALMTALTHTVRDWVVADNTYKRNVKSEEFWADQRTPLPIGFQYMLQHPLQGSCRPQMQIPQSQSGYVKWWLLGSTCFPTGGSRRTKWHAATLTS